MRHDLSEGEQNLLRFLSEEQFTQYGECCGRHLDSLVAKGFAHIHDDGGALSFITRKRGRMFNSVSLTGKGKIAANDVLAAEAKPSPPEAS